MENDQNQQMTNTPKVPKKRSIKWKIYLVIILIGAGAYGYFWFQNTNTLRIEAQQSIERANNFDAINDAIKSERSRCEQFISQKEGAFGSFEYCKKFIEWANSQNSIVE